MLLKGVSMSKNLIIAALVIAVACSSANAATDYVGPYVGPTENVTGGPVLPLGPLSIGFGGADTHKNEEKPSQPTTRRQRQAKDLSQAQTKAAELKRLERKAAQLQAEIDALRAS